MRRYFLSSLIGFGAMACAMACSSEEAGTPSGLGTTGNQTGTTGTTASGGGAAGTGQTTATTTTGSGGSNVGTTATTTGMAGATTGNGTTTTTTAGTGGGMGVAPNMGGAGPTLGMAGSAPTGGAATSGMTTGGTGGVSSGGSSTAGASAGGMGNLGGAANSGGAMMTAGGSANTGADQAAGALCVNPVPAASGTDENPEFSFFVTSMQGLLECAHGDAIPADTTTAGLGGNLGGLEGADAICAWLARRSNPGDNKTWRAFLSAAQAGPEGGPVNAIDRIGDGPWYDFNGRVFAEDLSGISEENDGRPPQISPEIEDMFPDEWGDPVKEADEDDHDTMTGSDPNGQLDGGYDDTCQDWTFNGDPGEDVELQVGHAWPRSENNGREWIQSHDVRGCMPGVHIMGQGGAAMGDRRAGAGGGYGGFYCFAVLP